MTKRILSILLAVLMLAGAMMSTTVTAADESPYKDVKVKRWSYADIMYVTENGLMNGTGEGIFAPAETMTRAMVVTVLYRLQGSPEVDFRATFSDVKADKWYSDAVFWASENDIVNGVGGNKFAPMDTITREQLAAIIMRYAPKEFIITDERADITGYADYKRVHDYAREALSWANAVGLITGKTETTLAPREGATREQFAAILRRFKEYDKYEYKLAYNQPAGYSTYTEKEYPLVTDADIYVAVDGSDSNPGTLEAPIATFAKAKEMVRELKKSAKDEIKVAFKAGDYGVLDNITFDAEDAGTEAVPITYCAYGDGDVIFNNGTIISESEFKALDDSDKALFNEEVRDSIKKVDLNGKVDEISSRNYVFSSTGVCHEARYPNKNSDGTDNFYRDFTTRYEEEGKDEFEYDTIILGVLPAKIVDKFSTVEGMKVTGMLRTGWLIDTFNVKSYNKTNNHLTFDFGDGQCENGYPMDQFCLAFEDRMDDTIFFHNLAELLDNKGEYWFDPKTKQLYIYAPEGDYAIADGGTFMTLNEDADYISFVGLEFNAGSETAVNITRADHVTFDLCTFANIAGNQAINASSVVYFTLKNSEISNFICGGLHVSSSASMNLLEPSNNVIENNYFHDFGLPQFFAGANALDIGGVATRVAHNIFQNGAHGAIVFGGIDNIIEYNIFENMMMTTEDFGAVYTWHSEARRDNQIRYNIFMNMIGGSKYGIYLDDGTAGQQVYGNIFYNVKGQNIVFNGGRDNVVHDNVFIKAAWISYGPGLYSLIEEGTPELVTEHDNYKYLMNNLVKEGEDGYDLWKERWPIMYAYNIDPSKVGEVECLFTTVHYLKNNYSFGNHPGGFGEVGDKFGVLENNLSFDLDENPIFTDPTHGDYSIREGVDFLDNQFYKIGRY